MCVIFLGIFLAQKFKYLVHISGLTSVNAHLNNATWISDYNFPAVLSRCKFPKTSDALHELTTNRNKNRQEPNLPPLPPEFASFAGKIQDRQGRNKTN